MAYSLKRKMTIFEACMTSLSPPPPQRGPHLSQAQLPAAGRSQTGSGR